MEQRLLSSRVNGGIACALLSGDRTSVDIFPATTAACTCLWGSSLRTDNLALELSVQGR